MRRNPLSITSLAIVAAVWLALRVPAWHERVAAVFGPSALSLRLGDLASRYPKDGQAQLAACSEPITDEGETESRDRAYARAAALLPSSPAPHFLYASLLLRRVPLHRGEEAALYPPGQWTEETTPLTPQERKDSASAGQALRRAGELDPHNAAVDYLRAYLALAGHHDGEAFASLRRALPKPRWDLYRREATQATFRLLQHAYPRRQAADYALAFGAAPVVALAKLARTLAGMSALAAQQGRHDRAIFLRDCLDHLASLTLAHAYGSSDASLAQLIATYAGSSPLPVTETTDTASSDALVPYLTEHGRPDLAGRTRVRRENLRRVYQELKARRTAREAKARPVAILGSVLSHVAWARGGTITLLLLVGLGALVLRIASRPIAPIRWPRWAWVSTVLGCALVTFVVGALWQGERFLSPLPAAIVKVSRQLGADFRLGLAYRPWATYYLLIFLPLLLLALLVVVLLHRRRQPEPRQAGFWGHYIGSLLLLLLPLSALLSLVTLGLVIPAARYAAARGKVSEALLAQGYVAYYHLDSVLSQLESPTPGSPTAPTRPRSVSAHQGNRP